MFMVYYNDAEPVYFDTYEVAEHYARMTAGNVMDVQRWETVARFS